MNEIETTTGRIRQFVSQAMFDARKAKDHPDFCTGETVLVISKALDSITNSMSMEFKIRKQRAQDGENVVAMGRMRIDDDQPAIIDGTVNPRTR